MEKKPVYSIFPAPPTAHPSKQQQQQPRQQQSHSKTRQSTESRNRPSLEQSPYPPPSSPLPPVPRPHAPLDTSLSSVAPGQQLPPTPDSLRPVRLPSRRKNSPNREFADFQRELAQTSSASSQRSFRPSSPPRGRPRSPKPRSLSNRDDRSLLDPRHSPHVNDSITPSMQTSTLTTSSASSISLSKPPLLSPTTTVAPSPHPSMVGHHRPKTVYFHGSIGGAGNYRKVISENKRAPRAYAANAEPLRRSSPTRFLSSMFGKQKAKGVEMPSGDLDERASGSEESVREEVDLGAAEALRRKMMGVGRRKKNAS